jgi:hypothetical protein
MVTAYKLLLIGTMVHSKSLKSIGGVFIGTYEVGETSYPPECAPDAWLFALKDKYSAAPLATMLPLQDSPSRYINNKSSIPQEWLQ